MERVSIGYFLASIGLLHENLGSYVKFLTDECRYAIHESLSVKEFLVVVFYPGFAMIVFWETCDQDVGVSEMFHFSHCRIASLIAGVG